MAKTIKKTKKSTDSGICKNRRASHDYLLSDKTECGLSLMGWEVKSIRAGKAQLVDGFVVIHQGEAWLHGANITPLNTASTHVICEPRRNRKLLMKRKEIDKYEVAANAKGYTLVALEMYWKGPYVKCRIALGKGKQAHDKRQADKEKDWNKQKESIMKKNNR